MNVRSDAEEASNVKRDKRMVQEDINRSSLNHLLK